VITRIAIYDFDHTLFRSPTPPKWWGADKSWWRDSKSLLPPCVPARPPKSWWNQKLVQTAKKDIADPNTYAILATGRWAQVFEPRVRQLAAQAGLKFDTIRLPATPGSQPFKKSMAAKLLKDFPDVTHIQVYDDHPPHSAVYKEVAQGLDVLVRINDVNIKPKKAACVAEMQRWVLRNERAAGRILRKNGLAK
jgi:hypothetical protein